MTSFTSCVIVLVEFVQMQCAKEAQKRGKMKQTLYSAHAEDTGSTAVQPEGILMGNTRALQSP